MAVYRREPEPGDFDFAGGTDADDAIFDQAAGRSLHPRERGHAADGGPEEDVWAYATGNGRDPPVTNPWDRRRGSGDEEQDVYDFSTR